MSAIIRLPWSICPAAVNAPLMPSRTCQPCTERLAFRAWQRYQLVRCYIFGGRAGIEPYNAQSRLQAIVDTAVDAIITIDSLGNVKDFSRSAERLFGRAPVGSREQMLRVRARWPDD